MSKQMVRGTQAYPLPPDVLAHYRAGYIRSIVDVIPEARARWPERDSTKDLITYLEQYHQDEETHRIDPRRFPVGSIRRAVAANGDSWTAAFLDEQWNCQPLKDAARDISQIQRIERQSSARKGLS